MACDPQKHRAQSAVARALASGVLPPPGACEACGREQYKEGDGRGGVQYHHARYEPDRWLDVIPLCRSCHRRVHAGSLPEPRTGRVYEREPIPGPHERFRPVVLQVLACGIEISTSRLLRLLGLPNSEHKRVARVLSEEVKAGRVEKLGNTCGARWRLAVPA